jgi:hypothetical protein
MTLTISNNAFKKYASLTKIDLDPKFTEIEVYPHAFEDCANFADTEFVSKVTAFKKGRYDNEDESADTFKNCGFTEVVINAEVGWIPEGTFKDCRQLSKVTFKGNPNNISIGLTSFENTKATFDEYPELAKKFKDYKTTKAKLFFSANSMELEHRNDGIIVRGLKDPNMNRLFVPKDITKIDVYKNSEFGYSLDKVSEIQLNEGITTLGCFGYSFSNLKKINFPDSITTIDSGCNLFKSGQFDTIVLPHNVTELPEDCFYYNRQVKTVVLPKNLKTIGRRCFCGCQNLEYIVIPDGVTSIGDNAFQECTNLEAVFLPPSVISVGKSAFEGCSKLRYIIFPLNLRQIPYRCCWHCKSLEWVVVGRYTSIYDGAIKKTGVTWIELTRQEWLECTGQYPKKVEEPEEAEFDD